MNGGGAVAGIGAFVATSCDFGAVSADQNTSPEVKFGGFEADYGDDATFTCQGGGCL